MGAAYHSSVRGTEGVGFRPFVYRLAHAHNLAGWVLNGEEGVEIWLEGERAGLEAFLNDLKLNPPPAAHVAEVNVVTTEPKGFWDFTTQLRQEACGTWLVACRNPQATCKLLALVRPA